MISSNLSAKRTARISGLLYLIVVLTGIFSLAYVPGLLFNWDNAALTFDKIVASETLFRLSIVSSVICYVTFTFLPVSLYRLLKSVNESVARLMVVLAITSVPVSLVNLQNKLSVLSLISKEAYLEGYTTEDLQGQTMFYLHQYDNGILIVSVFWGLWLLPFGYLVYRSGLLPKLLGILLMAGCFGYLVNFLGNMLVRDYGAIGIAKFVSLPASIGEIGTCLWLLLIGVKSKKSSVTG